MVGLCVLGVSRRRQSGKFAEKSKKCYLIERFACSSPVLVNPGRGGSPKIAIAIFVGIASIDF
jgi:hypothetical protein